MGMGWDGILTQSRGAERSPDIQLLGHRAKKGSSQGNNVSNMRVYCIFSVVH